MLNKHDLCKQLGLELDVLAYLHAKRVLPEPVRIGGECRWRENDIRKFKRYLLKRAACRARGVDPDSPQGPSVPIYSTAGRPRLDPRLIVANEREAERQTKSRTLSAGSDPIVPEQRVELPEPNQSKVEG